MPTGGVEQIDEVKKQKIHSEHIKKEQREFKLYQHYSINPFRNANVVTGKINSVQEAWDMLKPENDSEFINVIARANLEPTKKYIEPQTTNQDYGWISQPLVTVDKADQRLYFPQNKSAITHFWETAWHHNVSMSAPKAAAVPK